MRVSDVVIVISVCALFVGIYFGKESLGVAAGVVLIITGLIKLEL
jgi:hypothetical protein